MMSRFEAVLFDLGDTLVDLGEGRGDYEARVAVRAMHVADALTALGAPIADRQRFAEELAHSSEARYRAAVTEQRGIDIYDVLRWFLPRMGIPPLDAWVEAGGNAFYQAAPTAAGLRIGARAVLEALSARGYRLGVISNTLQPGVLMDRTLAGRGLLDFFPVRVYSSDARVAKPHPGIFRAALEALGLPPERTVYVGDRLDADVAGAQAAGMKGVLIEVAHRPERNPAIAPDGRIAELPELPDVLARMEAASRSER
jgi:putative hydrolase of the HAD superfamily